MNGTENVFESNITAEARANYNKNIDMTKKLVDVTANAKVDGVKFQTHIDEILYSMRC